MIDPGDPNRSGHSRQHAKRISPGWFILVAVLGLTAGAAWWYVLAPQPEEETNVALFALVGSEPEALVWQADISIPRQLRSGWPAVLTVRLAPVVSTQVPADLPPAAVLKLLSTDRPIRLEGRLELPGATSLPPGTSLRQLRRGQPQILRWDLTAQRTGKLAGTLWLYVRYQSEDGTGEVRLPVLGLPLELESGPALFSPQASRAVAAGLSILALFSSGVALRFHLRYR